MPYFQDSIFASSSKELAIRAKLCYPYAIGMSPDPLNQVQIKLVLGLFMQFSLCVLMNPRSYLHGAKVSMLHGHVLVKLKFDLVHSIGINGHQTYVRFTITSYDSIGHPSLKSLELRRCSKISLGAREIVKSFNNLTKRE